MSKRRHRRALYFLWVTATALAGQVAIYLAARLKIVPWCIRPVYLALAPLVIAKAGLAGCRTTRFSLSASNGPATVTVASTPGGVSKTTTVNMNVN